MQKVRFIKCLVFLILQNVLCGPSVFVVNNTVADVSSLNSTPRKESGILRDILNQESMVRFSMVQKMQEFSMDVIEMKKNNDFLMRKLDVLTEEQTTSKEKMSELRRENENMKYQISALQNDVNDMNVTLEKVRTICGTHGKEINELGKIRQRFKDVTDVKENLAQKKQEMDQQRAELKMMEDELQTFLLTINSTIQGFVRDINGSMHEKVATNSKTIIEQRSELDAIHSDLSIVLRQLKNRDRYKVKSNLLDQNGTKIDKNDSNIESFKETDNLRGVSAIKDGVRLVDGESWMEGRVEIYKGGRWGTICDANWDTRDASVVCKTMAFSYGTPVVSGRFGYSVKPVVMGNVSCDGSELNIQSCPQSSAQNCKSGNVAGVACTNRPPIRLVNGLSEIEGRVEIYTDSGWGTVCDEGWDDREASVICRHLGYKGHNALARSGGYFGEETSRSSVFGIHCIGTEEDIQKCGNGTLNKVSCSYGTNAGVSCLHIRLVGGRDRTEGRVEVYINNKWGTVCDDDWDNNDAQVVCNHLGFPSYTGVAFGSASFGQGSGRIWLDNVGCTGYEHDVRKCRHSSVGTSDCHHSEDAGVRCVPLRLVEGSSKREGRVEVYMNNQWGTVCDNDWTKNDAQVVCENVGYAGYNAVERPSAYFGEGTGDVLLDEVHCTGKETDLLTCSHEDVGKNNCTHNKDAGVSCLSVRLVGGKTPMEGRVEVLIRNEWGTICDTNWEKEDAAVICRMLGYDGLEEHPKNGF